MQTTRAYFESLTVPALKDKLTDFKAVGISRLRKPELVNFLLVIFEGAHLDAVAEESYRVGMARQEAEMSAMIDEAVAENRKRVVTKIVKSKNAIDRMISRVNGYMRQNGTDKLTSAQWRRIRKNERKHGLNINKLSLTFP